MTITARYMLSEFISVLGNGAAAIIMPLILLMKTGDALAAGTLALICAVPQILAGIFGGAVLDLYNRRNVMIASDIISALSVAMLPVIEFTVGLNFGWFALMGIIGAIGDVPGMTARDVLLPSVIARDGHDLQKMLAVIQSMDSLAIIIGPSLAALLIHFCGEMAGLWVTATLSLVAAAITSTLPKDIAQADAKPLNQPNTIQAVRTSLYEGYAVIKKSKQLVGILLLTTGIGMVIGGFQGIILPVYFTEIAQTDKLGYVLSALSAGTLIGPMIYALLTDKLSARKWYVLSIIGTGVGIAIIATLPHYALLLFGAFVAGAMSSPFSALLSLRLFDLVPEEKRGAVFGLQNTFLLIALPLAIFVVSLAVQLLSAEKIALALGLLLWLVILWAVTTPTFRQL